MNWDEAEFNLVNMVEKHLSEEEVCRPVIPGNTIFPTKQTLQHLKSLCLKLNSKVPVVKSREIDEELNVQLQSHLDSCSESGNFLSKLQQCYFAALLVFSFYR